jgi:LEA14-like dessication related protein
MNGKSLVAFGIAAAAAIYFFGKNRLVQSAKFSFEKLSFDLKKRKVNIVLGILNPTSTTATVQSIVGTLIVNGKEVANIENYTKVAVKPKSKSLLPLTITPSALGIFQLLKDYVSKKTKGQKATATFNGTANVGGTSLPLKISLV